MILTYKFRQYPPTTDNYSYLNIPSLTLQHIQVSILVIRNIPTHRDPRLHFFYIFTNFIVMHVRILNRFDQRKTIHELLVPQPVRLQLRLDS